MPAAETAYLWCPAYPLADASARIAAEIAARDLTSAASLRLVASPLLEQHPGPGAWLPVDERRADLARGSACDWLLAARGGYGCLDLLAELDHPLPAIIGYSDLTVLHAAQQVVGGPGGIYGVMPGVPHGPRAVASAAALIRGEGWAVESLPGTRGLAHGTAHGPLFAGCLRVLAGLVGTRWLPDLRGWLVALEDIDEKPYRIDRDLFQLHASGALDGIAGLVFGTFPAERAAGYAGPSTADICGTWADRLGVPAVLGVPFGHDPDPLALAIGRPSVLTVAGGGWRLAQRSIT